MDPPRNRRETKNENERPQRNLAEAGDREALLFSADQIAKWLTQKGLKGVDFDQENLGCRIREFAEQKGVPKGNGREVSLYLQKQFHEGQKEWILQLARELYQMAKKDWKGL